jgi:hypothetical protein
MALRTFGEHGTPLSADALGIPVRTRIRHESGATIPGLGVLCFVEVTGVEPHWLLTGEGRRY